MPLPDVVKALQYFAEFTNIWTAIEWMTLPVTRKSRTPEKKKRRNVYAYLFLQRE